MTGATSTKSSETFAFKIVFELIEFRATADYSLPSYKRRELNLQQQGSLSGHNFLKI
jgi:hypothetical protein